MDISSGNNKGYKHYLITKKGREFLAHKMTGQRGTLFSATYINRFHELEERSSSESADSLGQDVRVLLSEVMRLQRVWMRLYEQKFPSIDEQMDMGSCLSSDGVLSGLDIEGMLLEQRRSGCGPRLKALRAPSSVRKVLDVLLLDGSCNFAFVSRRASSMGFPISENALRRYKGFLERGTSYAK